MRQALKELSASLLFGLISILLIIGGLATALAEKNIDRTPTPKLTETSLPTSVLQTDNSTETPVSSGLVPSASSVPASPTHTATFIPSTTCPAPPGWSSYIVQLGDSLDALATRYNTTTTTLKEKNCLVSNELLPDTRLYMPPSLTATPIPCGPPANWTARYTVQSGDNLYRIGLKYRVNVSQLQQANCLGYSTQIKVGQVLKVPNVPTSTPAVTNTSTPTKTQTPSQTPEATATFTPVDTDTPVPTQEATIPPTEEATEEPTQEPEASETPSEE